MAGKDTPGFVVGESDMLALEIDFTLEVISLASTLVPIPIAGRTKHARIEQTSRTQTYAPILQALLSGCLLLFLHSFCLAPIPCAPSI